MSVMSDSSQVQIKKPLLGNLSYAVVKHAAAIAFPALNVFYVAVAQLWHLPKAEEVSGSIAAFNALLGILMGISSASYNKSDSKYSGVLNVTNLGEGTDPAMSVEWDSRSHLEALKTTPDIVLRVNQTEIDQPVGE